MFPIFFQVIVDKKFIVYLSGKAAAKLNAIPPPMECPNKLHFSQPRYNYNDSLRKKHMNTKFDFHEGNGGEEKKKIEVGSFSL